MIRVAIAEDERAERERFARYIQQYEKENQTPFQIFCFPDGAALLDDYPQDCDILFLDIEMKPVNGLDAAKAIRKMDENVIIIFVTNLIQFALEGYAVNALNFIVKPVNYKIFALELKKALTHIGKRSPNYLRVKNRDGIALLDISNITYAETAQHKTVLHTQTRTVPCNETMNSLEKRLVKEPFFRCHTAYLVNLNYVERYQGCDLWVAGECLQISRHRRKEFLEVLASHIGGMS
ncbi:MAG: LytTR family DNA-binding domain-containing protein [Lachnospiraceae bacterium]|nr:LytTR family DNA-binding domain-containing protein [Lachnospiraceae bacterium]